MKATPLSKIRAYGEVLPFLFTITNEGDTDVFLARVDAYAGQRWEMKRLPRDDRGRMAPGQSIGIEVPYRVIDGEEHLLLTLEMPGTGRVMEAGATVTIPCPPAPFDPGIRESREEGWTYSVALEGFVLRLSRVEYQLRRQNEARSLPPLPFELLKEVDLHPDGVKVLTERGGVRPVDAADLMEFLVEVRARGRRIATSRDPSQAPYEIVE